MPSKKKPDESAASYVSEKSVHDEDENKEKSRRESVPSHVSAKSEEHVKGVASASSVTSQISEKVGE